MAALKVKPLWISAAVHFSHHSLSAAEGRSFVNQGNQEKEGHEYHRHCTPNTEFLSLRFLNDPLTSLSAWDKKAAHSMQIEEKRWQPIHKCELEPRGRWKVFGWIILPWIGCWIPFRFIVMNNRPSESEYGICEDEKEESPLSKGSPFPLFVISNVRPHLSNVAVHVVRI
jgi:hypothetical protein